MLRLRTVGALGLAAAGGAAAVSTVDPKWKARREALVRGSRLALCVATIAAEHTAHSYLPDVSSSRLQDARAALAVAQAEQERAGVALEQALGRSGGSRRRVVDDGLSLDRVRRDATVAAAGVQAAAAAVLEAEAAGGGEGGGADRMHARNARRLVAMARENKGCYLKIAQHIAQLGHLLPPAYVTEAATCLDACPVSDVSDVRLVVAEELGASPEELFGSFDDTPIASASLAQVRRPGSKGVGGRHRQLPHGLGGLGGGGGREGQLRLGLAYLARTCTWRPMGGGVVLLCWRAGARGDGRGDGSQARCQGAAPGPARDGGGGRGGVCPRRGARGFRLPWLQTGLARG